MPLPPTLITELKPILLPYMRDRDEREALLIEAFFLLDPRPLEVVTLDGGADIFAVKCMADLISKVGCVAGENREHTLSVLLKTVRSRCDALRQAEIDRWLPILNDECIAKSHNEPPRPDASPVMTPPQTLDTPIEQRQPSVFISYSHADDTFAQSLIDGLQTNGHPCWIDTSEIKGGADWQKAICEGINASYAVVVVCSKKSLESEYVWDEVQWARNKRKLIIPVLIEDVITSDRFFGLHRFQGVRFDQLTQAEALQRLLAALPVPLNESGTPRRARTRRECELSYLERLKFEDFQLEKFELGEYAAMGGVAQTRVRAKTPDWDTLHTGLHMNQAFVLLRQLQDRETSDGDWQPEAFTDAVSKLSELRRAVVLGEPGAGKTHTLRAIAKPLYIAALTDPTAPIPVLIKLGNWDNPTQSFEVFVREALGELGDYLSELLTHQRAVLLFDGLNEMPADQRTHKYPQVETFIKNSPRTMAIVTCREADYTVDLKLNRVMIRPLDALCIRDFANRALKDAAKGENFFWRLAGDDAKKHHEAFQAKFETRLAEWERVFWLTESLPEDFKWGVNNGAWEAWLKTREEPASLLVLARNPYMLRMLLDVYIQFKGGLPANRGQLFDQFVNVLLAREKLALIDDYTHAVSLTPEGTKLGHAVQELAYEMQVRRAGRAQDGDLSAGTALPIATAQALLTQRQLYLAVSANLLLVGETVRFSHQLLQEYFAARYMDAEIRAGRLEAAEIWDSETWWERTNWEEAAILLAGLYSDDCTPVLDWLAEANPEVAALCIVRSGAYTPEMTRRRLRDTGLRRAFASLSDKETTGNDDVDPKARAAVGRALGMFKVDGQSADIRRGIGLRPDRLPDFEWVDIPAGTFLYGEDKQPLTLEKSYKISRYPVTFSQFQTFIDAPDGFYDPRWWDGLADDEHRRQNQSARAEQTFLYDNHPRENVSWYDAMAFCRWLSVKLNATTRNPKGDVSVIRLPTEFEWEYAARGTDGRRYPYGNDFDPMQGNLRETGIGLTSAVGIFPSDTMPHGLCDMSGNVWEWCLSNYQTPAFDPKREDVRTSVKRAARGGSWNEGRDSAKLTARYDFSPYFRAAYVGFRVVLIPA